MKTSKEILSKILISTQIGQAEIKNILKITMGSELRKALELLLHAYNIIETETYAIAEQRGWELKEFDPAKSIFQYYFTRIWLNCRDTDSQIAHKMITKNMGMVIHGLKNLHQFHENDPQIAVLAQRHIDCMAAAMKRMTDFL